MNINVGDIFVISLNPQKRVCAQIVSKPDEDTILIVVFDFLHETKAAMPQIQDILRSDIALFAQTLDAKLYNKHWKVIGNSVSNLREIYLPYYKIGSYPQDVFIVDYRGDKLRAATLDEFNSLQYQNIISPAMFEDVIKAYFDLLDWDQEYEEFLYSYVLDSVNLVEDNGRKLKPV